MPGSASVGAQFRCPLKWKLKCLSSSSFKFISYFTLVVQILQSNKFYWERLVIHPTYQFVLCHKMYWKISKNDKRVQKVEHYFREQEEDLTRTAANKQEKFKVWSNLNRTANKPTFLSEQPQKKFLKLNPVAPKQVPAKIVLKRSFQFQLFLGDKKKHLYRKALFV